MEKAIAHRICTIFLLIWVGLELKYVVYFAAFLGHSAKQI